MYTTFVTARFTLGPVFLSLAAAAVLANEIVPVEQVRSVRAFVINPRCQPSSGSQIIGAPDFGPFHGQATFELECGGAFGAAQSDQHSEIHPLAILGRGEARSQAASEPSTVIHAITFNTLDVTFSIAEPTEFALTGELRAMRQVPPAQNASAAVTLHDASDVALASHSVMAPADGTEMRQAIDASGPLLPGTYRLRADARTLIDASIPPGGGGEAAFVLRLSLPQRCPADLNGDGQVDLNDLALLLSQFGCTGDTCLSDIDDDGDTDLSDLTLLLGAFGTTCP